MPRSGIHTRYVFRSRFHPLPRRGSVNLFSATGDTRIVSQPGPLRNMGARIAAEAIKSRHRQARRIPYVHLPPVEDSFSYVWPHVKAPITKGVWFRSPHWHQRHIVHGRATVVPPVTPFTYTGDVRSTLKLCPTFSLVVELRPTFDVELDFMLEAGRNSNDIKATALRDDTGAAIEDATMYGDVFDQHGSLIETVTLTHQGDGEYRGTITAYLGIGVPYTVDVYATDYRMEKIKVEKARRPLG